MNRGIIPTSVGFLGDPSRKILEFRPPMCPYSSAVPLSPIMECITPRSSPTVQLSLNKYTVRGAIKPKEPMSYDAIKPKEPACNDAIKPIAPTSYTIKLKEPACYIAFKPKEPAFNGAIKPNEPLCCEAIKQKEPVCYDNVVPSTIASRIANGTKTPVPLSPSPLLGESRSPVHLAPIPPENKPGRPRHRAAAAAAKIQQLQDAMPAVQQVLPSGEKVPSKPTICEAKPAMAEKPNKTAPRRSKIPVLSKSWKPQATSTGIQAARTSSLNRKRNGRRSAIPVPVKKAKKIGLLTMEKSATVKVETVKHMNWIQKPESSEPKKANSNAEIILFAILSRIQHGNKTSLPSDEEHTNRPASASGKGKAGQVLSATKQPSVGKIRIPILIRKNMATKFGAKPSKQLTRKAVVKKSSADAPPSKIPVLKQSWLQSFGNSHRANLNHNNNNVSDGRISQSRNATNAPVFRRKIIFQKVTDYEKTWFNPIEEIRQLLDAKNSAMPRNV